MTFNDWLLLGVLTYLGGIIVWSLIPNTKRRKYWNIT